ncbi:MAG: DUF4177 domain-containing protein [Chloroflexota bacterium]
MERWEYLVVQVRVKQFIGVGIPDDLGARINQYGSDGWELARTEQILRKGVIGGSFTDSLLLFFKRPLQSAE